MNRQRLLVGALFVLGWCPVAATQLSDHNVEVLGRWNQVGADFNDIWGYVADDGREIAILGHTDGTSFLDTTDPANPVQLAFVPGNNAVHRDMKTYQGYCYVVTEGGGGLQIIDIRDPDNIALVKTWGEFSTCHNVFIDVPAGLLYGAGSDRGFVIASLADPLNPATVVIDGRDVHDLYSGEGFAHLHLLHEGRYAIIDLSQLPAVVETDSIVTPQGHTHSGWVSPDKSVSITCDEFGNGHIGIYDVRDPWNIRTVGEFDSPTQETIHNAYLLGDVAHASWYRQGYVAVDLSQSSQPRLLGSQMLDGDCWGCYPYQPSGNVYCSVMQNGLWIVRLVPWILHADVHPSTEGEDGPYRIRATAQRGDGTLHSGDVFLHWRVGREGEEHRARMSPTDAPHEYLGEISGVSAPAVVHYWVSAGSGAEEARYPRESSATLSFSIGARTMLRFDDFEIDDGAYTHGVAHGSDDWQRGEPAGEGKDPFHAASGTIAWGTALDGSVATHSDRWLRGPTVDVGVHRQYRLRFQRWLRMKSPDEFAQVLVNGMPVLSYRGQVQDDEWVSEDVDISGALAGAGTAQVEFRLRTGSADKRGGWTIDDVELYALDRGSSGPGFEFLLSFTDDALLPGEDGSLWTASSADVVHHDARTGAFAPYFDASDVGLTGADVCAVAEEPDGSLLLAFRERTLVPGLTGGPEGEWVRNEDVIRFVPTTTGEDTTGSFEFLFDGSDLGLRGTRIDGVAKVGGYLDLSVRRAVELEGIGLVRNEDIARFRGKYGEQSSGTWTLWVDGSEIGLDLVGEELDAISVLGDGSIGMSTRGNHEVPGIAGRDDDVLQFDPGTGTFTRLLDGLVVGLAATDVDAVAVREPGE